MDWLDAGRTGRKTYDKVWLRLGRVRSRPSSFHCAGAGGHVKKHRPALCRRARLIDGRDCPPARRPARTLPPKSSPNSAPPSKTPDSDDGSATRGPLRTSSCPNFRASFSFGASLNVLSVSSMACGYSGTSCCHVQDLRGDLSRPFITRVAGRNPQSHHPKPSCNGVKGSRSQQQSAGAVTEDAVGGTCSSLGWAFGQLN